LLLLLLLLLLLQLQLLVLLLLILSLLISFIYQNKERNVEDSRQCSPRPGNSDLPPHEGQELEDQLTQEQFDNELENDLEVLLTQEEHHEEQGGVEGRGEEADEGEGEDDSDSSSSGYESPEDPHPQPPRRRPTEDKLDQDFDPTRR
jgi:hypothetical protein